MKRKQILRVKQLIRNTERALVEAKAILAELEKEDAN